MRLALDMNVAKREAREMLQAQRSVEHDESGVRETRESVQPDMEGLPSRGGTRGPVLALAEFHDIAHRLAQLLNQ